jgi:hypothetical protein
MVTTFITRESYDDSAKDLDNLRLKKQCVEAFQLLYVLDDLHYIARKFNMEKCPPVDLNNLHLQDQWVKKVWDKYRDVNFYFYISEKNIYTAPKDKNFFMLDSTYKKDKHYFIAEDQVKVLVKAADYRRIFDQQNIIDLRGRVTMFFHRTDVIIKELGDRVIKLGYANHPAARMWLTYENSLVAYLNAHLREYYIRNSKHMNIPYFDPSDEVRPWWIRRDLIFSHRASLIRKFKEHYQPIFSDLPVEYFELGYIWPSSFNKEKAEYLVNDIFDKILFSPAKVN